MLSSLALILTLAFSPQDRVAGWQQDLETFRTELAAKHKNPLDFLSKDAFDGEVRDLAARVERLSDTQVVMALQRIVAKIGDAHTTLMVDEKRFGLGRAPISFRKFKEGWFVVGAAKSLGPLVGAQLVSVGGEGASEAVQRLSQFVPTENEGWQAQQVAALLSSRAHLAECGLKPTLRLEMQGGAVQDVEVAAPTKAVLPGEFVRAPRAEALAKSRQPYYSYERVGGAMVLTYNRCQSDPNNPSGPFFEMLFADLDANPVPLIVDLRQNGGGNNLIFRPVITGIQRRPWLNRFGQVYALIGRGTFSSAMMNAHELRTMANAILVGEPTGGSPNGYGEVKNFILPKTKIVVSYSTKYFKMTDGKEKTIRPDVLIPETAASYFRNEDEAMKVLLLRIGRRL